ncbi:uncharacterized protein LOC124950535 isoform X3 [Vespa velutina]|uniref:uncharacterized protein LOC124950535 isoform X3 n=1 Tax=Vespa velutina TaxID=202808 RepID=UPI001FB2E667|nr:uncharacterized protein LOC124950535 isoform X3 [Vespa velutina]
MPIKAATSKDRVAVHLRISDNPTMAILIWNVLGFLLLATSTIISGLPALDDSKIIADNDEENSTLSLDLVPPMIKDDDDKNITLFIINLYAVRNHSGEASEEVLDNSLIEKMPDIIGPLATIFLVVEEGEDEKPVDLDEMAKYMEKHGFKMDKIDESGETSVLRTEIADKEIDNVKDILESTVDNSSTEKLSKSKKYRARRMACHKCHGGGGGGGRGGGGGYGGGGGGGSYQYYDPYGGQTIGVIPVYVVPVAVQQQPQRPQYHPPPQPVCDPCQGNSLSSYTSTLFGH